MPTAELLQQLTDLSLRLDKTAPVVKPFVRFPPDVSFSADAKRYWDFDHLLQVRMAQLLRQIASPQVIVAHANARWATNLASLLANKRKIIDAARQGHQAAYDILEGDLPPTFDVVFDNLPAGSDFLYLGAGSGRECLKMDSHYQVVGIDFLQPLLALGTEWARFANHPAHFVCMDAMQLGFASRTFDGVFLEFYGAWPALYQTQWAQREMARVLKPDGLAFIHTRRRCYHSFWFLMGLNFGIEALQNWIVPQHQYDFAFSEADGTDELIQYGIYGQSHTCESFQEELSHAFEVISVNVSRDPRYLIALARPRQALEFKDQIKIDEPVFEPKNAPVPISTTLNHLATLCDILEALVQHVKLCFEAGDSPGVCFKSVQPDLASIFGLFREIMP